jgi:hypothetical protein
MDNWHRDNGKRTDPIPEAATQQSTVKPGQFPIGSIESRAAAARTMIENKNEPKTIVRVVHVGGEEEPLPPPKRIRGSNVIIEHCYEDTDSDV